MKKANTECKKGFKTLTSMLKGTIQCDNVFQIFR